MVKWMGVRPEACDLCKQPLKKQFVDGKTVTGPWAFMCESCHILRGCGFGTGKGQRYDMETLKKVEG